MKELTQARLKEVLQYNPETGDFIVIKKRSNRCKPIGSISGTVICTYLYTGIDGKNYVHHRLAFLYMNGSFPKDQVDHINGIRTDNRFCNLREVSNFDNCRNKRMLDNNTSGINGISWDKKRNKWRAYIYINEKHIYLGRHNSIDDAINARSVASIKYGFHDNHGRNITTENRAMRGCLQKASVQPSGALLAHQELYRQPCSTV